MKKLTIQLVAVCALLAASLFYASAQTGGARPTPTPKPVPRVNACCNQTGSGGLTGCNKPYFPPEGGATCPGKMVKAKCDRNYSNCTQED